MPDFTFVNPSPLVDDDLELALVETQLGDSERDWLPSYCFEMRVGGCEAGRINIRIGNTPAVVGYCGHIGYAVDSQFRGNHYAERACRLILPIAKAHGMDTVWIMCNPNNAASRRTIERLGGELVEIVSVPEGCDLYNMGDRESCRYRLAL